MPNSGKALAMFFDGTWNEPADHTNVRRLCQLTAETGAKGRTQKSFYDEGVGTHWYDRLSGGAFGKGLSDNVRSGYRWLMENYDPDDDIFIFGFSRGAFTARSLAGVIARCGLLKPDAPISFAQLYERYQKGDRVRPIYELKHLQQTRQASFDFEEKSLLNHTYYGRNLIKMVGVWDTVGSIGVPFGSIPGVSADMLKFHNTHLSVTVEHSYQALALDEYRKDYWAILWTLFVPDGQSADTMLRADNRFIEQRWFSGAHANVGGGYRNDYLAQRPLSWIQEKAISCGLTFRNTVTANATDDLAQLPRDSYKEFLYGAYSAVRWSRYVRWCLAGPVKKVAKNGTMGAVITVNERIDPSVFHRYQMHSNYRPLSLDELAPRWAHASASSMANNFALIDRLAEPVITPGLHNL